MRIKDFILYAVIPIIVGGIVGFAIVRYMSYRETYNNSRATIVSQKFVPAKNDYAYIVYLRTYPEYKYKRNIHVTNIQLSNDTSASCDDGDTNGVASYGEENVADKDLMTNLFSRFTNSKYNASIKKFTIGTKVQTGHYPAHYEIMYTSSWNKNKTTFNSKKAIQEKQISNKDINMFRVDNRVQEVYYTN